MPEFAFSAPRPLRPGDPVDEFDCGVDELNRYLSKHALQAQGGDGARTYVSFSAGKIAAYYTLAYGAVEYAEAPARTTKGLSRHPVPVLLLARLATDERFKGQGLGTEMLRDALLRTLSAAEIAGLRAVVVDAKNDGAKRFYERFGFESFPGNPYRLNLILKDVRAILNRS